MTTKDAAQQRWQQSDAPGKEAANRAESTQVLDRFFKLLAYVCPVLMYKPNKYFQFRKYTQQLTCYTWQSIKFH